MNPATGGGAGDCDLSGRWLITQHLVSDALGALQYTHYVNYFEIEQQGDAFEVKKGILCGFDTQGTGAFAASTEFHASWPSVIEKLSFAGQRGTSTSSGAGCKLDYPKYYTVRGATVSFYSDPANVLPNADQPASDSMPGWEDWDGDGNPGITGNVSGPVIGKIFCAPRMWTQIAATVPSMAETFKVPVQWNQEQNVMSFDGTPLLGSEAVRAADNSLHFAEWARLSNDQATGADDNAICNAAMELAPTLTPLAAGL